MEQLQKISLVISVVSFLIPLLAGYKNRQTLLWKFILLGFVFDLCMVALKRLFHVNIFPLANLYVLLEYLILTAIYYKYFPKSWSRILVYVLILSCALYTLQMFCSGFENRNGIGAAVFYFYYIIYSLLGFFILSQKKEHLYITDSLFFWMNVAVLIGCSAKAIFFLFEDYLIKNNNADFGIIWVIYRGLNLTVNVLFAVALSKKHE